MNAMELRLSKLILHLSQYILFELGLYQTDFHFQFHHRSLSNLTEFARSWSQTPATTYLKLEPYPKIPITSKAILFDLAFPKLITPLNPFSLIINPVLLRFAYTRTEKRCFQFDVLLEAQCASPNFLKARNFASSYSRHIYIVYIYTRVLLFICVRRLYLHKAIGRILAHPQNRPYHIIGLERECCFRHRTPLKPNGHKNNSIDRRSSWREAGVWERSNICTSQGMRLARNKWVILTGTPSVCSADGTEGVRGSAVRRKWWFGADFAAFVFVFSLKRKCPRNPNRFFD